MPDLAVLIPTRGRPGNIRKVIAAWDFTNAWDDADMVLVIDKDDPELEEYCAVVSETDHPDTGESLVHLVVMDQWMPMVHKLDRAAVAQAGRPCTCRALAEGGGHSHGCRYLAAPFALGFAGDDHVPQTIGWAKRYLTVLREMTTGMVYGDDGYQGAKLSTEWAVTSDVVRALGRMVPAPVEHMYCDNSIMDLFMAAGALRHLPEVRIEHMHPIVGKAETDAQYQRVNHRDQFAKDRAAYQAWQASASHGMVSQVDAVRALRAGLPEFRPEPISAKKIKLNSTPRRVPPRSTGVKAMSRRFPFPRHFKNVRGATPDEIGIALADFAARVPADQEIVELGVFQGRTALQMAWGAEQGQGAHVTGIDPWDLPGNVYDPPFTEAGSRTWARYHVQALGYANKITLIHDFSHNVAEAWGAEGAYPVKQVGLLFVDGDHTKEGARRDIEAWAPHLAPGAVIAIDDYGHPDWPGVGEAVDELVAEGFLAPIEIFHDRLAVTRLGVEPGTGKAGKVTAVTSEGVSPSPYPAVDGQVAAEPDRATLEAEWEQEDPEGVAALRASAAKLDAEASKLGDDWDVVRPGELEDVAAGTAVGQLNIAQLKMLARVRGIKLGVRKDKRDLILQALQDGL